MSTIVQPNVKHSAEVVAELQVANIEVGPIPGTPLYNVINEIASLSGLIMSDATSVMTPEQAIEQVMMIVNTDEEYSHLLEQMISSTAAKVKTNIQLAQQEVLPLIRSLVEDAERAVAERVDSTSLNVSIKPTTAIGIWSSGKLQTYLPGQNENYNSYDTQSPSCFFARPAELNELVLTGAASLDAEITEWLGSIANAQAVLETAWNTIFAKSKAIEMSRYILSRLDNNEKLAVFLIANNLTARDTGELVDLVEGISLRELQNSLNLAKVISGIGVQAIFDRADTAVANNLLILSAPTVEELEDVRKGGDTQIEILVSGPVYESFLAQGGTPDSIIGAVFHKGPFVKFADILENIQMYERIAERTSIIVRETAISKKVSVVIDQLRKSIFKHLEAIVEDASEYKNRADEVSTCLEKLLADVHSDSIKNMHELVTTVVCALFYDDKYDVKIIIDNINRQGKANTGVAVRELATLATYDYVARYLVGQLVSRKAT